MQGCERIAPAGCRKAARRKEAQLHGERRDQEDADPEHRYGNAELRDHRDEVAVPAVTLDRGENAEWQGKKNGAGEGEGGEWQRQGQAAADFLKDRHAGYEGGSEVEAAELTEIANELRRDRQVGSDLPTGGLDLLGIGPHGDERIGRVSRQKAQQQEQDSGGDQHRNEEDRRPTDEIGKNGGTFGKASNAARH